MPANEQTWRNTKLLHVVFAVSSVAMLLTTLWMTADDNDRPWKDYQRKFIDLDAWSTAARATEQESADFEKKQDDLQKALDKSPGDIYQRGRKARRRNSSARMKSTRSGSPSRLRTARSISPSARIPRP